MLLVTHFDPFGQDTMNSSQEVLRNLPDEILHDVVVKEIPTSKVDVEFLIPKLLMEIRPHAVLALGQAEGRTVPSLEWIGVNLVHSRMPDNRGQQHQATPIVPGGPDAYFTSLPILRLHKTVQDRTLPIALSSTAGLFMCNQAFYLLRHHAPHIPAGFLHLPYLPQQVVQKPQVPSMALELQVCITTVILQDIKDWLAEVTRQ